VITDMDTTTTEDGWVTIRDHNRLDGKPCPYSGWETRRTDGPDNAGVCADGCPEAIDPAFAGREADHAAAVQLVEDREAECAGWDAEHEIDRAARRVLALTSAADLDVTR
jgi:hypothetical protein